MKKTTTFFLCSLLSLSVLSQNRSLHFDGSNDYLAVPENTSVLTGSTFTFEAWVKPTSFSSYNYVVNKGTANNSFSVYFSNMMMPPFMIQQQKISFFAWNGATSFELAYNISAAWLNQWHHVAVSCNGSTVVFYIDGTVVGSQGWTGGIPTNAGYLRIGCVYNNSMNFAGCIDEVRIWNVGRTQAQIQSFMNTEVSSSTTGLNAYYRMNQGAIDGNNTGITTVTDLVVSPTNGTLTNFTKTGATSNFTSGYALLTTLPLKDASFTAIKKDDAVQLSWKSTPSEFSTIFEIERSTDGMNFSTIGTINSNPSPIELDYSFIDQQPAGSVNHYRVKSISNGHTTYSKIIAVRMQKSSIALQTYPNPVQSTLSVQLNAPKGTVNLQVKDLSGRTVQSLQVQSTGTTLYTTLDVSQLPKGHYVVLANNESSVFIKQ